MTKMWLRYFFLLLLATAFIGVQWVNASTHIHLSEQHSHDGHHHHHHTKLHSHDLSSEAMTTHAFHQISHVNATTLDHENCLKKQKKQKKQQKPNKISQPLLSSETVIPQISLLLVSYNPPLSVNIDSSYFKYSTTHSRAPPQTA